MRFFGRFRVVAVGIMVDKVQKCVPLRAALCTRSMEPLPDRIRSGGDGRARGRARGDSRRTPVDSLGVDGVSLYRHCRSTDTPTGPSKSLGASGGGSVPLPHLASVDPSLMAYGSVHAWVEKTLVPDALARWDRAAAVLKQATGAHAKLLEHRTNATFPELIKQAVPINFEPQHCVGADKSEAFAAAKSSVLSALLACRSTLLQESINVRASEIKDAEAIIKWESFKTILEGEWTAAATSLCAKIAGVEHDAHVVPHLRAAFEDLKSLIADRSVASALEMDRLETIRRERELAVGSAKMAVDEVPQSAAILEMVNAEVKKQVAASLKASLSCFAPSFAHVPDTRLVTAAPLHSVSEQTHAGPLVHQKRQSYRKREQQALGKYQAQGKAPGVVVYPRHQVEEAQRSARRNEWKEAEGGVEEAWRQQGVGLTVAQWKLDVPHSKPSLRALDVAVPLHFSVGRPASYPLDFFRLSVEQSRLFVFQHSTALWLDTRMARPTLINPQDITVPPEILPLLAMNIKFIPRPRFNTVEPLTAWDRLVRAVRIRYYFREEEDTGFDPKFHVPSTSGWEPPEASSAIEFGLKVGHKLLTEAISSVDRTVWRPNISGRSLESLARFLSTGDVLIKPADKNLGLAVLSKDWYISEGLRHMADSTTYRVVPNPDQAFENIVLDRETLVSFLSKALAGFISEQKLQFLCAIGEESVVIPVFHTLPKVHKVPLKGRPIVPSHSWYTTGVSIYLDTLLQPLIRKFPWVLRDSKDLLRKLSTIRFAKDRPVWIVTADMSSMYTCLPSEEGGRILQYIGEEAFPNSTFGVALRRMLAFVLENNYLSFNGKVYHQVSGTAMGTPCAPSYANLFVGALERALEVPSSENLLFYGRFIDDVLAIIQGPLSAVDRFRARLDDLHPDLKFEFECSSSELPFLDALVVLEKGDMSSAEGYLRTEVYQKPLNAYQYIPWSSYHPEAVKLAFVKGELIRYVRLSSRRKDYIRVMHKFWARLRARGYPIRWLRKAFAAVNYYQFRGPSMVDRPKRDKGSPPLVYHSSYNPVWDQVNGGYCLSRSVSNWRPGDKFVVLGSSKGRIIRCIHRARNLGDIVNTANKQTLAFGPSQHKSRRLG